MAYDTIEASLNAGQVVLLDGATGTELQRRGAPMDPTAWSGAAHMEHEHMLAQVHLDYIRAGSRVITANTFATSRMILKRIGLRDQFEAINQSAVDAALRARDDSGVDVCIAGSVSHMVPRADTHDAPSQDEIADAYGELAQFLTTAGCELLLLEMMFRPARIKPAMDAVAETGLPVWCGFSARRASDGRVLSFAHDEEIPFDRIASMAADRGFAAAGIMHSESEVTGDALAILQKHFSGPLTAYPDSGHMKMPEWQFQEIIEPEILADFAAGWRQMGVQVLGGCCGFGPEAYPSLGEFCRLGGFSDPTFAIPSGLSDVFESDSLRSKIGENRT